MPDLLTKSPSPGTTFWEFMRGDFRSFGQKYLRWPSLVPAPPTPAEVAVQELSYSEADCRFRNLAGGMEEIPWLRCDPPQAGPDERAIRQWLRERAEGLPPKCDFQGRLQVARAVFQEMIRPRDQGGFGLEFDWDQEGPYRGLGGVFRERKATCMEFVILFLLAAQEIGIEAVPILALSGEGGTDREHLLIGFPNPVSGEIQTVADHWRGYFGQPDPGTQQWIPLSRLDMLIYYYNLRAAGETEAEKGLVWVDRALALKPDHYLSLFNKAYFVGIQGDWEGAKGHLLRSVRDFSFFTPSFENLAYTAQKLQNEPLKAWAFGQRNFLRLEPGVFE